MLDFVIASLLVVGIGLALRGCGHGAASIDLLRDLILKVALPATVAAAILQAELRAAWAVLPLAMVACSGVTLAVFAAARRGGAGLGSVAQGNAAVVLAPFAAPGITTFPFIGVALGTEGLAQAAVGHIGCVLAYLLGVPLVVALARRAAAPAVSARTTLRRLAGEPILLSAIAAGGIVALDIRYDGLPVALRQGLDALQALLAPLVLVFVGLTVRLRYARLKPVLRTLSLRLAVSLAFAAGVLAVVPLGPVLPIVLVVLPLSAPPLYGVACMYAVERGAAGPVAFDHDFALDLYGLALPACMAAVVAALLVPQLAADPRWLALATLLPLTLFAALADPPETVRRRRASARRDDGANIVDVGERRPGHEAVAHGREGRVRVVAAVCRRRIDAGRPHPHQRGGQDERPDVVLGPVGPVAVAGERRDAGGALGREDEA